MPLVSLAVRIITSSQFRTGTDNDVYFDIGALGWKLDKSNHDDFESGSDNTYPLSLPSNISLTTDDILWLRLQKKGIGGFIGTLDGIDGEWKPQSISLIVNSQEFASVEINTWLNHENPVWKKELIVFNPDTVEQRFVLSLRIIENAIISGFDETVAILTTPFKLRGISGWLSQSLPITCATGIVIRSPAISTDGLATIDLKLEQIIIGNQLFILGGQHNISHIRFIRVEYKHSGNRIPRNSERVQICGEVKWDTDREGWYEIHPRNSADVIFL